MLHIALSIFCFDVWFYMSHRILHSRTLYPLHSIHHKYVIPTIWDSYEGHWVENIIQGWGTFFPFVLYSYSLIDIGIILLFINVRGMMRHDERFIWLIGNHHLLHHRYPRYNYGEYWLDRLFATLYPKREEAISGLLYM